MSLTGLQLRHAVAADLEAIVALERSTQDAPHWPPAAYSAIFETRDNSPIAADPNRCIFVAEVATQAQPQGSLVGFAVGLSPLPVSRESPAGQPLNALPSTVAMAELESVAVAAFARRKGIGRALCIAVLDWCRGCGATSIGLEVRLGSVAAIALYSGLGFEPLGRRPRYYRDPEDDALLMQLRLK